MPTEISDFIIIAGNKTSGQDEHRLGNPLRNCFVRCPSCSEIWVVPGATENEHYSCAECRHTFLIKSSTIAG